MTTKSEEKERAREMKALYDELIKTLLKRAGIKESDIYKAAIKSWASKNLDLLTPSEVKKYQQIIRQ